MRRTVKKNDTWPRLSKNYTWSGNGGDLDGVEIEVGTTFPLRQIRRVAAVTVQHPAGAPAAYGCVQNMVQPCGFRTGRRVRRNWLKDGGGVWRTWLSQARAAYCVFAYLDCRTAVPRLRRIQSPLVAVGYGIVWIRPDRHLKAVHGLVQHVSCRRCSRRRAPLQGHNNAAAASYVDE